jgi:tetratricopeptide (TPR) repeat protein
VRACGFPGFVQNLGLPMKSIPNAVALRRTGLRKLWPVVACWLLAATGIGAFGAGVDREKAAKDYLRGAYREVSEQAREALKADPGDRDWSVMLARSLWEIGKPGDAREVMRNAMARSPFDLRLRAAAYEIYKGIGAREEAAKCVADINVELLLSPGVFSRPEDELAAGRLALGMGVDPKRVLESAFDPARKAQPENWEIWVATAELALEKGDPALAVKTLGPVAEKFGDNPEVAFVLARAYASSDSEAAGAALERVFRVNPGHAGACLYVAGRKIDEEDYSGAEKALEPILERNPRHPESRALRAVVAHLRGDVAAEMREIEQAYHDWPTNPAVAHLAGLKLSQHYRFEEGAKRQRQALGFDPRYLPAKWALANDLLRLGNEEEGWLLAEQIQKEDPYNVVAFNLTQLRDVLSRFQTMRSEHFVLRMEPKEAAVYGKEALELLERAHSTLTARYCLALSEQTIVEIFPDQADFAIRTFGLPGGSGYLGVCFGRLITANSMAARPGMPANWHSVLWHEFGHVVTLTLTRNKMPRWLSEGISVYEERLHRGGANPTGNWGERMKPRYRAMLLAEDCPKVSELSGSFLHPKTPAHLGFAYYESSLVVEWLVEKWGLDKMRALLADLGSGVDMQVALGRHYLPLEILDRQFAEHARHVAQGTGSGLDWTPVNPEELATASKAEGFLAANPSSHDALEALAEHLMQAGEWTAAKKPLEQLVSSWPEQREPDSAYARLARVHRELGEKEPEIRYLGKVVELCASAPEALQRLLQIALEQGDWAAVLDYSERLRAIDPLRAMAHRAGAEALEATGRLSEAVDAFRKVVGLRAAGVSEARYRLGRLLYWTGQPGAWQEVLGALEEAPKYRDAYRLLLELSDQEAAGRGDVGLKNGSVPEGNK